MTLQGLTLNIAAGKNNIIINTPNRTVFVTCITYSTDYYQWLSLESWFTTLQQMPPNHSQ